MKKKTACVNGHPTSDENRYKNRTCKECVRLNSQRRGKEPLKPQNLKKRFCKYGHKRTLENLTNTGACKTCRSQRAAERYPFYKERKILLYTVMEFTEPERIELPEWSDE